MRYTTVPKHPSRSKLGLQQALAPVSDYRKACQLAVGNALTGAAHVAYYFNGEQDKQEFGALQLTFGELVVTLDIGSDGQSALMYVGPAIVTEAFQLDDKAHCAWTLQNLIDQPSFGSLIGVELNRVEAIVDQWKKCGTRVLSGWALHFVGEKPLYYWNSGDEAYASRIAPPPYSEFSTEFVAMTG
jgi:hypothetical protein